MYMYVCHIQYAYIRVIHIMCVCCLFGNEPCEAVSSGNGRLAGSRWVFKKVLVARMFTSNLRWLVPPVSGTWLKACCTWNSRPLSFPGTQVECGEALKSWMSTGGPRFRAGKQPKWFVACPESYSQHNMSKTHAKWNSIPLVLIPSMNGSLDYPL